MPCKIEVLNTPNSPAETITGAAALLQLKGLVPAKTLADAFASLCSYTATMSKFNTYVSDRHHSDRIPVIWQSRDPRPDSGKVYLLDFFEKIPAELARDILVPSAGVPGATTPPTAPVIAKSPAEAKPATSAGIPDRAGVAATVLRPAPAQPSIVPAPAPQEGFWTRLHRLFFK